MGIEAREIGKRGRAAPCTHVWRVEVSRPFDESTEMEEQIDKMEKMWMQ
jgi:thiamine biosynthesis lipoprotein ApbE